MNNENLRGDMSKEEKKTMVFHAVPYIPARFATRWASFPEEFKLVAKVETDSLDEAFRLTNTGEQLWWLGDKVTPYVSSCRSTSVGDVIVLPNGKSYRVLDRGFVEIFGSRRG